MTCHECELALGMEESSAALELHLAECDSCRELQHAIQQNANAMRELASDPLPVRPPHRAPWRWIVAAAAMLALAFGVSRAWRVEKIDLRPVKIAVSPPPLEFPTAAVPAKRKIPKRPHGKDSAPLMVKMFTSDPDVVIYWLIDVKDGTE